MTETIEERARALKKALSDYEWDSEQLILSALMEEGRQNAKYQTEWDAIKERLKHHWNPPTGGGKCNCAICRSDFNVFLDGFCNHEMGHVYYKSEAERLAEALRLILPMAKGYAHAHQVGGNQEKIELAEAALSPVQDAEPGTERRFVRADPDSNREGDLCGLCDSTSAHEHPRLRCCDCGAVGLAENMPGHTCASWMMIPENLKKVIPGAPPTAGANPATGAGCPRCAELERGLNHQERILQVSGELFRDAVRPVLDLWEESQRPPGVQMICLKLAALRQERDTLQARCAELEKHRDHYKEIVKNNIDDTERLRERARPVLGGMVTDSFGTPSDVVESLVGRIAELERERDADRTNAEENAADWCKLVDALIGNAEFTDKGVHIDQQGKALERIRDLIAAEGELGDAREALQQAEKALEPMAETAKRLPNLSDGCTIPKKLGHCRAALTALAAIRKALGTGADATGGGNG